MDFSNCNNLRSSLRPYYDEISSDRLGEVGNLFLSNQLSRGDHLVQHDKEIYGIDLMTGFGDDFGNAAINGP